MQTIRFGEIGKLLGARTLYRINDKDPTQGCHPVKNLSEASEWNKRDWGVFWTVNQFEGARRKENCRQVLAWAVDIDEGSKSEQLERIHALPIKPSGVIETARGYHVYFKAKPGASNENYRDITERLVDRLHADNNAKDICRILRVPGFNHCKDSQPFLVKVVESNPVSYSEEEMHAAFPSQKERKDQVRQRMRSVGDDDLFERIYALDCEHALMRLSGTSAVNHEVYSFAPTSNGKNILVNGKSTSCWIDKDKRIGSHDKGGPTVFQWLNWFHNDHKKVYGIVREFFPELFDKDSSTYTIGRNVRKTLVQDSPEAWGNIKPLPRALPESPQLTPDLAEQMIPDPVRPWILDIAERLQVPIESVAVCAFGALSGLIGRKICIFPKRNDSWRVLCVLWSALVDRPSRKKSATLSEAMAPLALLEDRAREEFKAKQAESKALAALRKSKSEAIKADMKEALREKDEKKKRAMLESAQKALIQLEKEEAEQQLTERRFRTCDATVEKLGELLVENPNGLIVYRDELSGWLKGLDRFGHEHERSFFLEAWNGTGSYAVDRIGRGTLHIPALCLTIMGGIQPGRLESYVHDAVKGGSGDDGLLQRFQLLVFPEKQATEPVYIDKKPNAEAREHAFAIYQKIHELNPLEIMATSPDAGVPGLKFSEEAQALFEDWFLSLEKRLHAAQDMPASFESHLGKYRSLMPALALMFHLISLDSKKIQVPFIQIESARMAAMWCDFLEAHARKVYAICIDPEIHSARALANRIIDGMVTDGMFVREIKRRHWSLLKDNDSVNQAIEVLEDCGWVKTESVKTNGKSKRVIRLNPGLVKARPE